MLAKWRGSDITPVDLVAVMGVKIQTVGKKIFGRNGSMVDLPQDGCQGGRSKIFLLPYQNKLMKGGGEEIEIILQSVTKAGENSRI